MTEDRDHTCLDSSKQKKANILQCIGRLAYREAGFIIKNPVYLFCGVIFPIIVILFFTSLMNEGVPTDMPCGVVDLDNTSTTRELIRTLDSFESTQITDHYSNVAEARKAIQRGDIYAFIYFPEGTTRDLLGKRQPKISFYYSSVVMVAGNMLFKDLKTVSSLGSAAIGKAKLNMIGKSESEIMAFLQPTTVDLHMIGNPWANYNVYLSSVMIPGVLMLLMFLITTYSIGTELKFGLNHEWLAMANNNIWIALTGKLLFQFIIFFSIMMGYMWYLYGHLCFPHPGGLKVIILLAFLTVVAAQGFGVFAFGIAPSLRMSMSISSLWGVVGFSACGATFPVFAMDSIIEAVAQLFPLRHYYMIYQMNLFNGYPLSDAWWDITALTIFACLPILVTWHIKKAMVEYVYMP